MRPDPYAKHWPPGTTESPLSDADLALLVGRDRSVVTKARTRRGIAPLGGWGSGPRASEATEEVRRAVAVDVPISQVEEVRARYDRAAALAGSPSRAAWALEVLDREAARLEARAARAGGGR